jgi:hypothetical protein
MSGAADRHAMNPGGGNAAEPLIIGGRTLEPAAWLGLGILGFVLVIMSFALWNFSGQGPRPIPIVWAVGGLVALRLFSTREVRIAPEGIRVRRHLFALNWGRTYRADHATEVEVLCEWAPTRHQHGDGTPEGELPLLMFTVRLRGLLDIVIGFSRDADAMEALARRAAALVGAAVIRKGYVRRERDWLPVRVRKRAESPLT